LSAPGVPAAPGTVGRGAAAPASGLGNAAAMRSGTLPGAGTSGGPQPPLSNAVAARTGTGAQPSGAAGGLRGGAGGGLPAPAAGAGSGAPAPGTPGVGLTGVQPQPLPGPEVVELKGKLLFEPSLPLAQSIKDRSVSGPALPPPLSPVVPRSSWTFVNVRFGELASGRIPVYWTDTGFETPPAEQYFPGWGMEMSHPAFPHAGLATPMLWIKIEDSIVEGAMGWRSYAAWTKDPTMFGTHVPWELLFRGMAGFTNLRLFQPITDTLWYGKLTYDVPYLTFDQGAFSGTGRLTVIDEQYEFEGEIDVPVTGLPKAAKVPVKLTPGGLFGLYTWHFDRSVGGKGGARISGDVTATLGNGSFDVRGAATYASAQPRINGRVEIIVDGIDVVTQLVRDRLGPDAPASIGPAAPGEGIGITGFGQLDFTLSDWMTGNAEVIVHPEGWVTARGEILPTKVVPLLRKREKERPVDGAGGSFEHTIAGVPLIGDVRVEGGAQLYAYGWFGPGTLHDIRITGLLSNHPEIIDRFELAGTISAPAAAGLRVGGLESSDDAAKIEVSAYVAHLKKVMAARISARGQLELQMYAEVAAAAGRRASKAHPAQPEYYLQGDLAASAALVLDLRLWVGGDLLFWSGKLKLVDRTWTLGTAGAKLGFEYVLGKSGEGTISTSFDTIDFDPGKFADAIVRGETVQQKDYEGKQAVETTAESAVVNPQAPTSLGPAAPGAAPGKQLEAPFAMSGEHHSLWLALIEPPDLLMESPGPERLLPRIRRAQANTRKDPALPEEERAARLGDLDKIEAQAMLVLEAAQKVEKESLYLSPSVPGFEDLAQLIASYGTRYQTTDLAISLADVSSDPVAAKVAEAGAARARYASVLARRPRLLQELRELEKTLASAKKIGPALEARVGALQARLAQLQEIDAISQAPPHGRIVELSARKGTPNYYLTTAPEVPGPPVVLEFPDGSRIWRDTVGGPMRHEATLGASAGRAGMERLKYTATKHGNLPAGPKYQRAHSLGQGTGFESPYGVFYAPEKVNQTLQNKGIEEYMRNLAAKAAPGETFRVLTKTTPHADTLRLARIDYSILRVAGGQREEVASYSIQVTSSKEHPLVTAEAIRFSQAAAGQALAGRVPPPDVLTKPFSYQY